MSSSPRPSASRPIPIKRDGGYGGGGGLGGDRGALFPQSLPPPPPVIGSLPSPAFEIPPLSLPPSSVGSLSYFDDDAVSARISALRHGEEEGLPIEGAAVGKKRRGPTSFATSCPAHIGVSLLDVVDSDFMLRERRDSTSSTTSSILSYLGRGEAADDDGVFAPLDLGSAADGAAAGGKPLQLESRFAAMRLGGSSSVGGGLPSSSPTIDEDDHYRFSDSDDDLPAGRRFSGVDDDVFGLGGPEL